MHTVPAADCQRLAGLELGKKTHNARENSENTIDGVDCRDFVVELGQAEEEEAQREEDKECDEHN